MKEKKKTKRELILMKYPNGMGEQEDWMIAMQFDTSSRYVRRVMAENGHPVVKGGKSE